MYSINFSFADSLMIPSAGNTLPLYITPLLQRHVMSCLSVRSNFSPIMSQYVSLNISKSIESNCIPFWYLSIKTFVSDSLSKSTMGVAFFEKEYTPFSTSMIHGISSTASLSSLSSMESPNFSLIHPNS